MLGKLSPAERGRERNAGYPRGLGARGALPVGRGSGPAAGIRRQAGGTGLSGVHLPRPHPFAVQAAELADLLAGRPGSPSAAGDAARKAVQDELTLQLPSAGGGPLASPAGLRDRPGVAG